MTRQYCDMCGELVDESSNMVRNIDRVRINGVQNKNTYFLVGVYIESDIPENRSICRYCRDHMIDLTYKTIVQKREEREKKNV